MASLKYTVDVDTRGARSSIAQLESSILNLGTAVAGGFAVGNIVAFGDSIVGLQNKIRTLTGDQAMVTSMFNDITKIAGAARAPLQETGDLYFRIARAAKDLGITQQQTADITESLAKSMSMTGATAAETSGALLQLGQALQSGRFQGDELRSVLENMPIVSKAMADELGVTIGELRKLGSEGKITSDVFVRAMQKNKKAIDDAFARSVPTAQQALNNLKTAAAVAFTELAQEGDTPAAGLAQIAEALLKLTNDVPKLTEVIKDLVNVLTYAGIAFVAFKGYAFVATGGFKALQGAIAAFGTGLGSAVTGMSAFGAATTSVRNGLVGLGTAFGIFDKSRGAIMKTATGLGTIGTTVARVSQVALSLSTILSGVLRIGLRFAGWVGVFLAVVDVINLLYKAVSGSNEKLIDLGSIFKFLSEVVQVAWYLLKEFANLLGNILLPILRAIGTGIGYVANQLMQFAVVRTVIGWIDQLWGKLTAFWNWLKGKAGVGGETATAAPAAAPAPGGGGVFGNGRINVPAAPGGGRGGRGGGGRSQADINKELKRSIEDVTKSYREQMGERLDALQLELRLMGLSEDQADLERTKHDILKQQSDALADLATKEQEVRENNELTATSRQRNLDLIAQQRTLINAAAAEELSRTEELIRQKQRLTLEQERLNHVLELQQLAAENRKALTDLEEQLSLVGLYGDALEDATLALEVQDELQNRLLEIDKQRLELERNRGKLGEERFAQEMAHLNALTVAAQTYANERLAAEKKLQEAQRRTERTDVKYAIGKRMEELKRSVDPAIVAVEGLNSVFDRMGSAIDEFVDTGKFKFGDFARSVIADIAKIALKAAATKIFTSIFGSIFGRAAGGPVMAGKPYLVGEQGPELFVPNSAGSIMTNASLNKNAGQGQTMQPVVNNTYITNNISAIDSRSVAQMFVENRKSLLGAATMARKELPYGT